jgi:NADH:ubiquinone oxidoreductase subunit C
MTRQELIDYVKSHFESRLTLLETGRFDPLFEIKSGDLLEIARGLRDDTNLKFDFLCNLGAVDTGQHFQVVYSVASITGRLRLDFRFSLPYEGAEVDSVQDIWPGVNWYEREMWELFGINVRNHNQLERFLLPDNWDQGHPMRKNWDAPDFKRMPEL